MITGRRVYEHEAKKLREYCINRQAIWIKGGAYEITSGVSFVQDAGHTTTAVLDGISGFVLVLKYRCQMSELTVAKLSPCSLHSKLSNYTFLMCEETDGDRQPALTLSQCCLC